MISREFLKKRFVSVHSKIITVVTALSFILATTVGGVLFVYDGISFGKTLEQNLFTTAQMLGINLITPLVFSDPQVASDILSSVKGDTFLLHAILYDEDKKEFAAFHNFRAETNPSLINFEPAIYHQDNAVSILHLLKHRNKTVGYLYLESSLQPLSVRRQQYIQVVLATLILTISIVIILSIRFLRSITKPIERLTISAAQVVKGDFSQRIPVMASDEIGQLANTFNTMLDSLEKSMVSKENLQTIIHSMKDCLFVIDKNLNVLLSNKCAQSLLRVQEQEIRDKPIFKFVDFTALGSDSHLSVNEKLMFVISKNDVVELNLIANTGEHIPCSFYFSPLYNYEDNETKTLCIAHDLRFQINNERELEKALKRAEEANKAKSIFLSRMSHELRTPLNAVLGFGQILLMSDTLSQKEFENVGYILEAGQHLLGLIDDILDIIKIEQNQMDVSLENCDVKTLFDQSSHMVASLAEKRAVKVIIKETSLAIIANQSRTKQVLINLMTNAIKYNHSGGEVRLSAQKIGDSIVELRIEDNGIGIDNNDLEIIFEPFVRLPSAQATELDGVGIGLAITRFLVQRMNGKLYVQSTLGKGSCFCLHFTVGRPIEATDDNITNPALVKISRIMNILYIEDNFASRQLLEDFFQPMPNVTLNLASSAEEGLAKANASVPDLILMDMNLPIMDGLEAVTILKNNPKFASTKIVAISANALVEQIDSALDHGCDMYLTKPINLAKLVDFVNRLCNS